ncbi:unnamed protein product, partial [Polarella glacialis]
IQLAGRGTPRISAAETSGKASSGALRLGVRTEASACAKDFRRPVRSDAQGPTSSQRSFSSSSLRSPRSAASSAARQRPVPQVLRTQTQQDLLQAAYQRHQQSPRQSQQHSEQSQQQQTQQQQPQTRSPRQSQQSQQQQTQQQQPQSNSHERKAAPNTTATATAATAMKQQPRTPQQQQPKTLQQQQPQQAHSVAPLASAPAPDISQCVTGMRKASMSDRQPNVVLTAKLASRLLADLLKAFESSSCVEDARASVGACWGFANSDEMTLCIEARANASYVSYGNDSFRKGRIL